MNKPDQYKNTVRADYSADDSKVAIINSVVDFGSTGQLARELYEYGRNNNYESFIFYGRGKLEADKNIIRIDNPVEFYAHKSLTLITGYQGYFSNLATSKLIAWLKREGIKKVILLNLHGYYLNEKRVLNYLKTNKIKTAYVTPDEYAGLGKCCYNLGCENYKTECMNCPQVKEYPKSLFFDRSREIFLRKKELYEGFNTMTIVGPETNLVKFRESALTKNKRMKRASWGIDLDVYKYEIDNSLYSKYGIPKDKVLVLTVASYKNERKGVREFFFETARRLQQTQYHFINVGYDGSLSPAEMPSNMTTIGYIDDQKELSHLYSISDLYFLASKSDTMPLSCLIAFACETPVLCFYTSGLKYLAPESSSAINYCKEISVKMIEEKVRSVKKKDDEVMRECRRLAMEEYSIEAFCKKVYRVIEE